MIGNMRTCGHIDSFSIIAYPVNFDIHWETPKNMMPRTWYTSIHIDTQHSIMDIDYPYQQATTATIVPGPHFENV